MAVAYSSVTTATADYGGGSGTLSVGVPSGLTTNDLWLITITADTDGGDRIGLGSGFTAVSAAFSQSDYPDGRSQWKIAGSSESAVNVSMAAATWRTIAVSQRWTGTHLTTPIGNIGTTATSASGSTITPGSLTVQAAGSAVISHGIGAKSDGITVTATPPSGYTEINDTGPTGYFICGEVAYLLRDDGTETPGAITFSSSIVNLAAQSFEIRPSAAGSTSLPLASLSVLTAVNRASVF